MRKKERPRRKETSVFRIGATYIGTVVGAGFASGQEVLQFFGYFGARGIFGIGLAALLFMAYGFLILELGRRLGAESHLPVIHYAGGRWLGGAMDVVITFFLFGALTAMVAGSGAIFAEQFGFARIWGNLVMALASVLTVLLGIHGVITAISMVVPLLVIAVIGMSLATLVSRPITWETAALIEVSRAVIPSWPLSALVYVSYNIIIAVAVLAPLGQVTEDERTLRNGAIFGGLGLGTGAVAIHLAILARLPEAARFEVPMIYVAGRLSPLLQGLYSIILLTEIYTTAVGNLYGFAARMTKPGSNAFRLFTIGSGTLALFAGRLGFATIVRTLYPAVGFAGLLFLLGLTYSWVRERGCR